MNLLFLNRSFWPDVEATGQLLTELCCDLAQHHRVTVITGQPTYGTTRPTGTWVQRDNHKGVEILRVASARLDKRSIRGRIKGLAGYVAMATWLALTRPRPDAIIVETDPPLLGALGSLLKAWHGCPMIFYLQDLFPEVGLAMGRLKPGPVTSLLWWATQLGLRRANRVVVLGEDMRRRVLARDIRPHRIEVIPNWIDTETVKPPAPGQSLRREWDLDGQFLVMYSGNLGLSQDLGQILEAAQTLRHEPIVFLFVGDGAAKADLMEKAASLSLSNVRFLPYQARDRLAVSLGTADLHLIPMQPGLTGLLVPSKLYGILAVGKAYVASVDEDSDVGRVTREANSGILVPPGRPAQLAKAILWAVSNRDTLMEMGERGRAVAQALFDRRLAVAKFSRMLLSIRGEQQDALATPDGLADSSQRRSAAIAAAVSSYRVRVDAGATGVPRCVAPNFFAPASIEAALATPD